VAILKCEKGHFFDDVKYKTCPHCSELLPEGEEVKTVSHTAPSGLAKEQLNALISEEKTVALSANEPGVDPVVGWIVCMGGAENGRDYRIHSGRNSVGRSLKMDISIIGDDAITRDNHCYVVYDPQSGYFFIVPGMGTNTYLNGVRLARPSRLDDDDKIQIGDSHFCFIAYCKGTRTWQ
jgi:hypothetical protein